MENKIIELKNPKKQRFQIEDTQNINFNNDIQSVNKNGEEGGTIMANDDYVTQKEINHLEEKIDLKFENMDTKINHLPTQFENMMLKEREHQDNKRRETNRFIWGTIVVGVIGIALSVVSLFL